MKTINNTHLISGGTPASGVAIAATVITGTAAIIEAGKTFVELGKDIGETVYTKLNPDDGLGKMVYEKKDYAPTYVNYQHPNNFHGDAFHNSFGGF